MRDLLAHFHAIDAIQLATAEQLAAAPGVGPSLAEQIHAFFHPEDDSPEDRPDSSSLDQSPTTLSTDQR